MKNMRPTCVTFKHPINLDETIKNLIYIHLIYQESGIYSPP
jgi:hypothetical protein